MKSFIILDSARGVFIPQDFAEAMLNEQHHEYRFKEVTHSLKQMLEELRDDGVDSEFYWDNWDTILTHYTEIVRGEDTFFLEQTEDGDLMLIHEDELEDIFGESTDADAYVLIVDLDERGEYRCHIEDCDSNSVWSADTQLVGEMIMDGFLKYAPHECVDELCAHLKLLGVLNLNAKLTYEQ